MNHQSKLEFFAAPALNSTTRSWFRFLSEDDDIDVIEKPKQKQKISKR